MHYYRVIIHMLPMKCHIEYSHQSEAFARSNYDRAVMAKHTKTDFNHGGVTIEGRYISHVEITF